MKKTFSNMKTDTAVSTKAVPQDNNADWYYG